MGYFENRKKSGEIFAGSKLNVPGQGIKSVRPGGNTQINQKENVNGRPR
jgi:hypothetical protein